MTAYAQPMRWPRVIIGLGLAGGLAAWIYSRIRPAGLPDRPPGTTLTAEGWRDGRPFAVVLESIGDGLYLQPPAAAAWRRMASAALADGVRLRPTSAFRTLAQQNWQVQERSRDIAAAPGRSPHQRGMAIDIDVGAGNQLDRPGTGKAWEWLVANAPSFGFRRHAREAWHYDWIGVGVGPAVA